jgi:hypothetical protein
MREYLVQLDLIRIADGALVKRSIVPNWMADLWDFVTQAPAYESDFGPFYYVASVRVDAVR